MVPLIVLVTIVVFILVDLSLRLLFRRLDETRSRRARQRALDLGLKLDVSHEAKSLKRVEVENPKARILAVDDEPVVLDSFRKILALDGYSVDTVEIGPEALGLLQRKDYDFLFVDLKMPGMDGLEVTKAARQLRPDVDVLMITGYATIESAVGAMKYGAIDYVQKPFTEEELVDLVNRSLIRRQDRIERQAPPKVHLVSVSSPPSPSERVFNIRAGLFVSGAHLWVKLEETGEVRLGIDDFARKTIGNVEGVTLPRPGTHLQRGDTLFTLKKEGRSLSFPSPVEGRITRLNEQLREQPDLMKANPFDVGWVCRMEPAHLSRDLRPLKIGTEVVSWYEDEAATLGRILQETAGPGRRTGSERDPGKSFEKSVSAEARIDALLKLIIRS